MSINEDFRTLNNHSAWTGRTYVPPSTIVHHLDDMSIMAGTIGGLVGGTEKGDGKDFTGRESGTNWEGETPTLEEIPSSEYTGGITGGLKP